MSKLFWSTLLITSVATGSTFIPVARSQTVSQTAPVPHTLSQFPLSPNPQVEPPVCFFTSTGGRTFDLESLCGASSTENNNSPSNNSAGNTPTNNSPVISSPNQTGSGTNLGPLTKPAINLPNVSPGGVDTGNNSPYTAEKFCQDYPQDYTCQSKNR